MQKKQIEEAKGKMKKFIKKRIKFRKYPHKRAVNVYVIDNSDAGTRFQTEENETLLFGDSNDEDEEDDEYYDCSSSEEFGNEVQE